MSSLEACATARDETVIEVVREIDAQALRMDELVTQLNGYLCSAGILHETIIDNDATRPVEAPDPPDLSSTLRRAKNRLVNRNNKLESLLSDFQRELL